LLEVPQKRADNICMMNERDRLIRQNIITVDEALNFLGYDDEIFESISTMDFEDELADKLGYRYNFNLKRFGNEDQMERNIYLNKF
tara:strand:+ start:1079 stop:1336 length:258 start_codon:yes stop_codon:yes gene_type:complete